MLRRTQLEVCQLEDRSTPAVVKLFATGAGAGGGPHVKAYNPHGPERLSFYAYAPSFTGGVRVATADVTGDQYDDIITVPASGAAPVRVFNGFNGALISEFYVAGPSLSTGLYVAARDLNGDGLAEVITSYDTYHTPTPWSSFQTIAHVSMRNALTGAPAAGTIGDFTSGSYLIVKTTLAVSGSQIILGQPNGAFTQPNGTYGQYDVVSYNTFGQLTKTVRVANSFVPSANGAIFTDVATRYVAAGDANGDGIDDITVSYSGVQGTFICVVNFVASPNQGPAVYILAPFNPYPGWSGEIRVAMKDLNGDGRAEIVTGVGPGSTPHVKVFNGLNWSVMYSFYSYDPSYSGGVWVG
jgi:hypothetical protein